MTSSVPHPVNTGTHSSGSHRSHWTLTEKATTLPSLHEDLDVDAVIVGGGIAGLSIALELVRSGKLVAVVEDGELASGETGRTSAHLVSALDDRYYHLQELFGKEDARLIAQSHRQAIDDIERCTREEGIECEFARVPGYLFVHPSDEPGALERELAAARECGLTVSRVEEVSGPKGLGPALRFQAQARFHPIKYINGLARAIVRRGGHIFVRSHADDITDTGIRVGHHRITAQHVVVATNSPVVDKYWMHLVQFPYRTYVIGALVTKDSLPDALWWDTGDHAVNKETPPYHYVRLVPYNDTHDLLLCGGEDHPTGSTDDTHVPEEKRYTALQTWAREHFGAGEIVERWSGQVIEPKDSIAYIGRDPFNKKNVHIVTGDSGNGLTHAAIAGRLITDIITGRANPLERIYRPSRFKLLEAGRTLLGQFFSGLASYFSDDREPTTDTSAAKVGEGIVMQLDGDPYGVYKDEMGNCHLVNAKCTHLQCTVKWNGDEKTWDCPCHGSRFTHTGQVINGPANVPLEHYHVHATQLAQWHKDPLEGADDSHKTNIEEHA